MAKGEGLAGRVWESAQPLTVDDYMTWEGRLARFDEDDFHAVVGVPLRSRTEVVGVLGLAHHDPDKRFGQPEIALLSRFAHLASLALESARLYAAARDELQERRRAEDALREAELRYRTLVEHLPLVTYISPADESVGNVYVSPQVETLLGYPAEDWIRNPNLLHDAVHPDDLERVLADAERLRETGEALRSEYRYLKADGTVVWVLDETILVRDEQGTPLWVQGFLVDITESKTAEETRARLASIVESSNDAITSASPDFCFTSWNAGAERMFGYTAEEVLGKPITLLMPPERQEEGLEIIRRVVNDDRVERLEMRRHRVDGGVVHVAFTYSPIHDSEGRVVGISAIGQDVTERKRAEAAIRESESKFRAFVETTEEWVWAMGVDGTHTYSNPAVERILGYRARGGRGQDLVRASWSRTTAKSSCGPPPSTRAARKAGRESSCAASTATGAPASSRARPRPISTRRASWSAGAAPTATSPAEFRPRPNASASWPVSRRHVQSPRPLSATWPLRTSGCASSTA